MPKEYKTFASQATKIIYLKSSIIYLAMAQTFCICRNYTSQ